MDFRSTIQAWVDADKSVFADFLGEYRDFVGCLFDTSKSE